MPSDHRQFYTEIFVPSRALPVDYRHATRQSIHNFQIEAPRWTKNIMGHTALVTVTIEDEWRVEPLYGTVVTSVQLERLGELFDRMIARPDWRHDERWWVGLPTPPAIRALWNGIALYWEARDEPDNYRIGFRLRGEPEWRWMDDEGFRELDRGSRERWGLKHWLMAEYPEGPPRRCYPRDWPRWALPPE